MKIIYISYLSLTIFRKLTKSDHKYQIPSGMTSTKNHYEGKLLTPTASQLSLRKIGNSSANFSLQSKTGRTHYSHHDLNSNHAEHVLLKGPPESESSSYPSSDRKQLTESFTTMANAETSCGFQSSSHYVDEGL